MVRIKGIVIIDQLIDTIQAIRLLTVGNTLSSLATSPIKDVHRIHITTAHRTTPLQGFCPSPVAGDMDFLRAFDLVRNTSKSLDNSSFPAASTSALAAERCSLIFSARAAGVMPFSCAASSMLWRERMNASKSDWRRVR